MALFGISPRALAWVRTRIKYFHPRAFPLLSAKGRPEIGQFNALAFLLALFGCSGAFAQVQPSPGVIPPFSTLEAHEYDSINLATLGIQLNVPMRSKAGHIPFSFGLKGAAQIQYITDINPPPNYPPHYFNGGPTLAGQENHIGTPKVQSSLVIGSCDQGGWVYYDAAGTGHPTSIGYLEPPSCGSTNSGASYTTDGSGIYVSLTYATAILSGYAIDVNGNKTVFPAPVSLADPNGNSISTTHTVNGSTGTTSYADTLNPSQTTLASSDTYTSGPIPQETDTWTDALGHSQSASLNTQSLPILTAFGCPNLDQTTAFNTTFPSTVSFPDTSTLTFTWETTYSNSSDYTGRLASITVPSGGKISYAYSGGSHGINCVDGTPATMTRTTPDGIWTYVHTAPATYGGSPTTTQVTDPKGNNIVYTFVMAATVAGLASYSNPVETERQVYNCCSATSANLIQTVITCYNNTNSTPTSCNASPLSLPVTEKDVYTTYPGVTGYSAVKTAYDTYGRITDVKTYDFNAAKPTNEKQIAYGTGNPTSQTCTAISTYIIGKPCSVTLLDSQNKNAVLSQTWNAYDSNGNLTQTWNLVSGSGATGTYLSKQYTYVKGVVQTSTDVNGQKMNYTTTSCNNMFVTSQYPTNFTNLTTSQVWDCVGGVVTSSTDANTQKTQDLFYVGTTADQFYRPLEHIDEAGNITNFTYTIAPFNTLDSQLLFNSGASVIETLSTTDSLGRPTISQLRQGPSNSNWDTQSRTFDSDGRLLETSLACVNPASTACSASTESWIYDGLNRPVMHTGTGGDVITKTYPDNDVLTKLTPAPTNENAKSVQKEYDGLGRLKSECLISSATGSASCNQANPGSGFLTTYTYDAAGRLLQTVENAQVATPTQTRKYTYDLLGRMLSETNPEWTATGNSAFTAYYTYDSVSGTNCVTTPVAGCGDLVQIVDANGNTTSKSYDGLHRNTSITYTGPNSNGVNKYFVYDAATVNIVAMTNAEGRLAEAYTCSASCTTKSTDEGFSYEPRGLMSAYSQASPSTGGQYYNLSATYWPDHSLWTVTGVNLPTLTYGGLDGEGRVQTVTASYGANPVSAVSYNSSNNTEPVGALLGVTLGTGDSQNYTYDHNTNRMLSYSASVGATPTVITGTLNWNPNGTLKQLAISDGYNSADTQVCSYLYDDFIRVAGTTGSSPIPGVNCVNGSTNVWNQTFTYGSDSFGNLTKTTNGPGLSWACAACYNTSDNHYNSTLSSSITYDQNGNLTNDTFHSYTWLADGHVATIATPPNGSTTSSATYDALGNKVEENVSGTTLEYVSAFGVNAQMSGSSEKAVSVDLPGGVQALYNGGSVQRFRFPDWQGTIRAEENPATRAFTESLAFAPFGERYAVKGAPYNVDSFTGKPDQLVSDEYDFSAREEHNGQGRWVSTDPMRGTGNKYVYADNNPLSKVDIYGLVSVNMNGIELGGQDSGFDGSKWKWDQAESHPPASPVIADPEAYARGNNYLAADPRQTQDPPTQQQDQANASQQNGEQAQNSNQAQAAERNSEHTWLYKLFHPFGEDHIPTLVDLLQGRICKIACAMGSGRGASQEATESANQMAEASAGKGRAIAGAGTDKTLRDAGRLASEYGGDPADWRKMATSNAVNKGMENFEIHYYQNVKTGLVVEMKTVPLSLRQ